MKRIIRILILLICLATLLAPAAVASADDSQLFSACSASIGTGKDKAPIGNGNNKNSPFCKAKGTTADPIVHEINVAANIIALITGVAAVMMILVSGMMFITAGGTAPGQRHGDPNQIKKARAMLTGAVVGLIIVVLAWTITRFVTDVVLQ